MSGPRHLWSGDWERESAAHAGDLEALPAPQSSNGDAPAPSARPEPSAATERARRTAADVRKRVAATRRRRDLRRFRKPLLLGLLVLIAAGVTYAATAAVIDAVNGSASTAKASPAWLGVDLSRSPNGALVDDVTAGSPAQAAGLEPGDVITQVGSQPVETPSDVASALAALHPGDQVAIDFQRGPTTYTTHAVLGTRPAHTP